MRQEWYGTPRLGDTCQRILWSKIKANLRRVKNPSNGVVDGFGLGEGLVATLVGNNPQAGCEKAGEETIDGPESEAGKGVKGGVRKIEGSGVDERVGESGSLVDDANDSEVPEARHSCQLGVVE